MRRPDAHYVQSLEEVPRKWCRIWLLQESPPRWNIGELRHLLENQIEEDPEIAHSLVVTSVGQH